MTLKDLVQQAEAEEVEVAEAFPATQAIQVLLVQQEMLVQLVQPDLVLLAVMLEQVVTLEQQEIQAQLVLQAQVLLGAMLGLVVTQVQLDQQEILEQREQALP